MNDSRSSLVVSTRSIIYGLVEFQTLVHWHVVVVVVVEMMMMMTVVKCEAGDTGQTRNGRTEGKVTETAKRKAAAKARKRAREAATTGTEFDGHGCGKLVSGSGEGINNVLVIGGEGMMARIQ
jgi:hypothetical protein